MHLTHWQISQRHSPSCAPSPTTQPRARCRDGGLGTSFGEPPGDNVGQGIGVQEAAHPSPEWGARGQRCPAVALQTIGITEILPCWLGLAGKAHTGSPGSTQG